MPSKLYKNGDECLCDPSQVDDMIKAGWSRTPEPKDEPKVVSKPVTKPVTKPVDKPALKSVKSGDK